MSCRKPMSFINACVRGNSVITQCSFNIKELPKRSPLSLVNVADLFSKNLSSLHCDQNISDENADEEMCLCI